VLIDTAPHEANQVAFTVVPELTADRAGLHVLGRF
jgi:hypothetical protein